MFCDWLAWLLRMKRTGNDVNLDSVHQSHNNINDVVTFSCSDPTEDVSTANDTRLACNEVCAVEIFHYK